MVDYMPVLHRLPGGCQVASSFAWCERELKAGSRGVQVDMQMALTT